ncbi:MAG: FAD-dependent oxidoreductase [Syntrophorhabdales bacterium]|jgi:2,4-dienoyl-CoA reductase-like NADH-dependent reductase (Old Yellow Enzyme family)/thioredoxin reductase
MKSMFPKLFEPAKIGRLGVDNRIIKAPTFLCMCNPDGSVPDILIRFYAETARGGTGLVIVEGTRGVRENVGIPLLCAAGIEYIPGLSLLAQAICDNGAKSGLQVIPFGTSSPQKVPSRIAWEEQEYAHFFGETGSSHGPVPQELTIEDIQEIIATTGDAARLAQIAGFDMVEIHAAHGALPHQFLSRVRNMRNDMYGGSLHNRMRFLVEVVKDVKRKTGADFPLSVRLSAIDYEPGGVVLEETLEAVKSLEAIGVDLLHISGGSHARLVHTCSPMSIPLGCHVASAEAVKKVVHIPVIASGSITTPELAEEILESGKADFVSLARPLFADPHWPEKAREGRPEDITPCIRCVDGCQDRSNLQLRAIRCTVNPTLAREESLALAPAKRVKEIAVIGGGPGGMEAARVCALRGHKVTLYEKRQLGGALIEASVPEFKSDIRRLITYYVLQMKKLGVKVIQEKATVGTVKNGHFDAVIVAVGADVRRPEVSGIEKPLVADAMEVLQGKAHIGRRVHIVGGGVIGVEVGLFLAEQDKEVVFTTRQDDFMKGVMSTQRAAYEERLAGRKVTVYTGRRLDSVSDEGAIVIDRNGDRQAIPADSVVLAAGFAARTTLKEQIEKETSFEVHAVGDCVSPRMIYDAIHEGYLTARRM